MSRLAVSASSQGIENNSDKSGELSGKRKGKRKADDEDEDKEGGDNDDGSHKRSKYSDGDQSDGKSVVYPYYKRNPRKYRKIHFYLGLGWVSIHRLKWVFHFCLYNQMMGMLTMLFYL